VYSIPQNIHILYLQLRAKHLPMQHHAVHTATLCIYIIPLPFLSSLNAFFTIAPHIFAYGFVLTLISLATSSPYLAAAAKSFDANSSNSLFPSPLSSVPVSPAFKYRKARCEYAVRKMRAWYAETGDVGDDVGRERWIARDRSVKSASMSDSGAEKMWASAGNEASIRILRSCARLTKALGYVGFVAVMLSSSCIPASIDAGLESFDVRRMMSFCCVSRMASWDEEMLGWGGNVVSIADASFDFAADDGSVSGSKSAFNMRVSFAESDVLIVSTAMLLDLYGPVLVSCSGTWMLLRLSLKRTVPPMVFLIASLSCAEFPG
jgi:hypothetical protein